MTSFNRADEDFPRFVSCFLDLTALVESQEPSYEYQPYRVKWFTAKVWCECQGNLAILDSQQKQERLLTQM